LVYAISENNLSKVSLPMGLYDALDFESYEKGDAGDISTAVRLQIS